MAKVLMIEDDDSLRKNLGRLIELDGHEVRLAGDAQTAIEITKEFVPDVLVADWMLGSGLNGLELASTLREQFPKLAVIIMTGYVEDQPRQQSEQANVLAYLEKPFDPDLFLDLIGRVDEPDA